ncbi:hypothetical protein H0H93_013534 [Arthromyces matolae]|nr:hypothetical protein H0H93_013534 [Arthromyces matolae]
MKLSKVIYALITTYIGVATFATLFVAAIPVTADTTSVDTHGTTETALHDQYFRRALGDGADNQTKRRSWFHKIKQRVRGDSNPNPDNPFLKEENNLDKIKERIFDIRNQGLYDTVLIRTMEPMEEEPYVELINAMQALYRIQLKGDQNALRDDTSVAMLAPFFTYFRSVDVNAIGHPKVAETWEKCRPDFVSWAKMANVKLEDGPKKKRRMFF